MLRDVSATKDRVVRWIQEYFENSIPGAKAVIGISGGKDSSVAAALCVEALGRDRVIGVTMPNGVQPDIDDSNRLIEHLGIDHLEVNIGRVADAFSSTFRELEDFKRITGKEGMVGESAVNFPPRIRMTVLYAVAQSLPMGGLVVNTCNASEDYVGYSTKYGDAAGDFSPLSSFTVEEVLQIGSELGLPDFLTFKTPSDGLSGMSDEQKLGFTYAALDKYIATGVCEDEEVKAKIDRLHVRNLHKLQLMPSYKKSEED